MQFPELQTVWGPNPTGERGFGTSINSNFDGTKIAYGSGKNVVIRDTQELTQCDVGLGHRQNVKIVQFAKKEGSPQLLSADESGQSILFKYQNGQLEEVKRMFAIGGRVFDVAFYPDDKGIAAVGDCKGKNGRVFTISGTDQGSCSGPKRLTSVDMYFYDGKKSNAKLVTTGDDLRVKFYEYSAGFSISQEDNAVVKFKGSCNMARFSPCGSYLVVIGSKQVKVLDPNNGYKTLAELTGDKKKGEHDRTISSVAWNMSSTAFATSSSDKSVKCWGFDGSSLTLKGTVSFANTSQFGPPQGDFQVGCCYIGDGMTDRWISVSLNGDLNVVALKGDEIVLEETVIAPTGEITGLDIDRATGSLAVGTSSGEILVYDKAGFAKRVKGMKTPKKSVGVTNFGNVVLSAGWDDVLSTIPTEAMNLLPRKLAFNGQPQYIRRAANSDSLVAIATKTEVFIVDKAKPNVALAKLAGGKAEITACALSGNTGRLAVGFADKTIRLFQFENGSINDTGVVTDKLSFPVSSLAFTSEGSSFAAGVTSKYVYLFDAEGKLLSESWVKHTSIVTDLDFSPDDKWLLSCGLEGDIGIWDMAKPQAWKPKKYFKKAHIGGVSQVKWLDENVFYSTGAGDASIKKWSVTL